MPSQQDLVIRNSDIYVWGTMSSKAADKIMTNAMLQLWMLQITFETHQHSWGCDHFSNATCEHAYSKDNGH